MIHEPFHWHTTCKRTISFLTIHHLPSTGTIHLRATIAMPKLYFYYSAMNAGKSTTLLQSAHNYEERGMKVLLFTPSLDNRAGTGMISSRIGLSRQGIAFSRTHDLFVHIRKEHRESSVNCVLVDEAQFCTATQILQLTLVVDRLSIPVLCYGLRTDFRGEIFEGSMYLLAWADELCEIKTICASGKKAIMNARLDANGERVFQGKQIDIGHHYVALSRKEFQLERATKLDYKLPEEDDEGDDDGTAHKFVTQ